MKAIPIAVNGIVFPSARAAARYIVTEESKRGNGRKVNTVHIYFCHNSTSNFLVGA